jgi:hypothetical protein
MVDRTASRFGLSPKQLAADTAYGSGGMLAWLTQRGIEPHIPVLDRAGQTNGMFTRRDFTYDRDRNLFICPGGKELTFTCARGNNARPRPSGIYPSTRRHVAALSTTAAVRPSAPQGRDAVCSSKTQSQLPSSSPARNDRRT